MLYYGDRCRQSLNTTWLYMGVASALLLLLVTIITLLVCLVMSRVKNGKSVESANENRCV